MSDKALNIATGRYHPNNEKQKQNITYSIRMTICYTKEKRKTKQNKTETQKKNFQKFFFIDCTLHAYMYKSITPLPPPSPTVVLGILLQT